jgi:hypothetical protein
VQPVSFFIVVLEGVQPEYGEIAQSVEQWTENPRVDSSILSLTTIFLYLYIN